jgi:Na+/H+ antiporter NhaB
MKMKIFNNPVRRHLLVATTRVCALLVFLISSPLLYFISTPVVASSLVTISFTVAFIGSFNKHTIRPSLPFDPSPRYAYN